MGLFYNEEQLQETFDSCLNLSYEQKLNIGKDSYNYLASKMGRDELNTFLLLVCELDYFTHGDEHQFFYDLTGEYHNFLDFMNATKFIRTRFERIDNASLRDYINYLIQEYNLGYDQKAINSIISLVFLFVSVDGYFFDEIIVGVLDGRDVLSAKGKNDAVGHLHFIPKQFTDVLKVRKIGLVRSHHRRSGNLFLQILDAVIARDFFLL